MNTLRTETLRETGACYSAASQPKPFHSNPRKGRRINKRMCCTYWLLPARRCGSLPLPGSCGRHRCRNLRPVCSVFHGRCVERRGSHLVAACAENGDCPCPFPPALHPCTTPLSGSGAPPLCSWEWRAPPWKQSGQMDAPLSGAQRPLGADGILRRNGQYKSLYLGGFTPLNGFQSPYLTMLWWNWFHRTDLHVVIDYIGQF